MEAHVSDVLGRDPKALEKVIAASIRMKAEVVNQDERRERTAHDFELRAHGGARTGADKPATKCCCTAKRWGGAWWLRFTWPGSGERSTAGRRSGLENLVYLYGPLPPLKLKANKVVAATFGDKKNVGGVRRFVLPLGIGDAGGGGRRDGGRAGEGGGVYADAGREAVVSKSAS